MAPLDSLLALLDSHVEAQASELARQLGISQSTFSRLMAEAGDRVCRMGRGRATRYARTRSVPGLGTRLPVHQVDEAGRPRRYGTLHLLAHGHHWLERQDGPGERFEGLPPFAADMGPQGYLGRSFSARYPELELPARVMDWSDDHVLLALARRGEDCTGDLILGSESLDRFLADAPRSVRREDFPELARTSLSAPMGSSAGGEQPKFAAYVEGRQVLVKFADADDGGAASRWRDLLVCESLALEAVRAAGFPAAEARWLDIGGRRFLEVERFDRIGARGRRALLSLRAIDNEYIGDGRNWTTVSRRLVAARHLHAEDGRAVQWLDTFGQLIGNTDRHLGNVSFFIERPGLFRLAPIYDMLPMVFAPVGASLVERPFEPRPPTTDTLEVWPSAARAALAYWTRLVDSADLSSGFRQRCAACGDAVEALIARTPVG